MRAFVDTNILVYAYDTRAHEKHKRAKSLIDELWIHRNGVLSTQVINEFAWVLIRKFKLAENDVIAVLEPLLEWEIGLMTSDILITGLRLKMKHKFSFWDSLIIQTALTSKCEILYSEDSSHGMKIQDLQMINPFG